MKKIIAAFSVAMLAALATAPKAKAQTTQQGNTIFYSKTIDPAMKEDSFSSPGNAFALLVCGEIKPYFTPQQARSDQALLKQLDEFCAENMKNFKDEQAAEDNARKEHDEKSNQAYGEYKKKTDQAEQIYKKSTDPKRDEILAEAKSKALREFGLAMKHPDEEYAQKTNNLGRTYLNGVEERYRRIFGRTTLNLSLTRQ